jgi:hypothetical protein
LSRRGLHKGEPEPESNLARFEAHPVIENLDRPAPGVIPAKADPHGRIIVDLFFGEGVFDCVSKALLQNNPHRYGFVEARGALICVYLDGNARSDTAPREIATQLFYEGRCRKPLARVRLIDVFVYKRDSVDPIVKPIDHLLYRLFVVIRLCEAQDTQDNLQIVLDSVLQLAKKGILVVEIPLRFVTSLDEIGYRFSVAPHVRTQRPKKQNGGD